MPIPMQQRRSLATRRAAALAAAAARRNPRNPRLRRAAVVAAVARYAISSFPDYLRLRLVDRAWRLHCRRSGHPPPPFPWLLLPRSAAAAAAAAGPRRVAFYDIPGGRSYRYDLNFAGAVVATGHGWVVMAGENPRRLTLVNPVNDDRRVLPWPFPSSTTRRNAANASVDNRFHVVLTSSPNVSSGGNCFLVVVTDRLLAYCRLGRDGFFGGWETLRAPGFRFHVSLSDALAVGPTTVVAVDERRRLWRVDLAVEGNPKVVQRRDTGFELPPPWTEDVAVTRQYLVESAGHVILVVSDERHTRVAMYKLNWDARAWLPAAAVPGGGGDGRVLLLGRGCSAAVPAASAGGRAAGSVLFVRQPSMIPDVDVVAAAAGGGGGMAWFWSESRVGAAPGDLLVLKKTVPHRNGEFGAGGDSFWFFPAVDPDENAI
uniref:KIB1-4 beta-propeller domain-containing protein n=1 Tax=Leersia perrieri TaxID=77586 RepID=A0A0D9XM74_9ORYZ